MPFRPRKPKRKANNNLRKVVKSMISKSVESKHTDRGQTSGSVTYLGSVYNLSILAQGTGEDERIGDKVTATKVMANGTFRWVSTQGGIQDCRVMLVRDSQCQGTLLSGAGVNNGDGNSRAPYSVYNMDLPGRYKVLADKFLRLDEYHPSATFHITKLLGSAIHYTGSASTDEGAGQILMILWTNNANADPTTVGFSTRLYYKDS